MLGYGRLVVSAHISQLAAYAESTSRTLEFAQRVAQIGTVPAVRRQTLVVARASAAAAALPPAAAALPPPGPSALGKVCSPPPSLLLCGD